MWLFEKSGKRINMKTTTENITRARVCSMRIQFNLRHNVQFIVFELFSVDSRNRIKTLVRTRLDRGFFDDEENACFWKPISVDRA